jgi:hypothetical protein
VPLIVSVSDSTLFCKGDSMKKSFYYAAGIFLLIAVSFSAAGAGEPRGNGRVEKRYAGNESACR